MSYPTTPHELGKARKAARVITDTTRCARCTDDADVVEVPRVKIREGSKCPICGTPVDEKLVHLYEIIASNAEMAVDQRQTFESLEHAFDSHFENVRDTCDDDGRAMRDFYDGFSRSWDLYRAYFAREADRQHVKVPDKLLGIEYRKGESRW